MREDSEAELEFRNVRREERKETNWIAKIRLFDGREIATSVKDISASGPVWRCRNRWSCPSASCSGDRPRFRMRREDRVAAGLVRRRPDREDRQARTEGGEAPEELPQPEVRRPPSTTCPGAEAGSRSSESRSAGPHSDRTAIPVASVSIAPPSSDLEKTMALRTRLTERFGLRHPIVLAPMDPAPGAPSPRRSARPAVSGSSAAATATGRPWNGNSPAPATSGSAAASSRGPWPRTRRCWTGRWRTSRGADALLRRSRHPSHRRCGPQAFR